MVETALAQAPLASDCRVEGYRGQKVRVDMFVSVSICGGFR